MHDMSFNDEDEVVSVTVAMSEALDSGTVTPSAFTLTDENGDTVALSGATLENVPPEAGGYALVELTLSTPTTKFDFNTGNVEVDDYQVPGLPPTPISGFGSASFAAALNPADTDFRYYYHD